METLGNGKSEIAREVQTALELLFHRGSNFITGS
jgi:gluconate kinase